VLLVLLPTIDFNISLAPALINRPRYVVILLVLVNCGEGGEGEEGGKGRGGGGRAQEGGREKGRGRKGKAGRGYGSNKEKKRRMV